MSCALVELESKIASSDTALIYFAGHGFAVDGTYYLLPVDLPAAGPGEEVLVRDASFAANGLSDRLQEKGAATAILILDACRGNPFPQPGKRSIGLTRGLTRMDPAEGMFVLFSAGQGQSALDRLSDADANPNFVFTRTLLKEMEQPGLSMVQIAKRTQREVPELAAKVNHVQVPAYYDQIVGDLILCRRARSRLKARSARLKRAAAKRASSAGAEGCGFASEPAADCNLHPLEQRGPIAKVFKLPPCDAADPNDVPEGATLYTKVPPKTASMQVELTYVDGRTSPTRTFNAPK